MNLKRLYLKFEELYSKAVIALIAIGLLVLIVQQTVKWHQALTVPRIEVIKGHDYIVYPQGDFYEKEFQHSPDCRACIKRGSAI